MGMNCNITATSTNLANSLARQRFRRIERLVVRFVDKPAIARIGQQTVDRMSLTRLPLFAAVLVNFWRPRRRKHLMDMAWK